MAARRKRLNGLSVVGFVFAMSGVVFLIAGHIAIGIAQMGLGVVLIAAGVSATKKSLPPDANLRTQPPAEGHDHGV